MRSEFLPFSQPSITEEDIAAVAAVLRSKWITTGPKRTEFENKFCEYVHCSGGVALASATGGMHLMLRALGIGPGDEVITPSLTWVSTANLIVLAGAKPVFVDVDQETLMVHAEAIRERINECTKLIIPVHFAGAPVDMAPIRRLAAERGIFLVEDAAHATGTEYQGERIGRQGTSIFSFHPIKNITTGEGGMVCSDDPALLERIRCLHFHGLQVNAYDRQTQGRNPQAEVIEPGYKYNLTDIAAVIGLGQLARVEEFNQKRAELAARYQERLAGIEEIRPLGLPSYPMKHTWHLFVVRLDIERVGLSRDDFMNALKKRNIGTGIHFRATHLQKFYVETLGGRRGQLPHTEWNSDRICSIPLFPDMTFADVDDVVAAIKDVLKQGHRKG
jgi:UDP-4-amino-4-deoxy-L-arabinose-oxoglutarate aminotransferase